MTGKKNVSLPCAVGSTSYIDTVKNSYYVDKTLLIRDLIDDHAAVTLFTRPSIHAAAGTSNYTFIWGMGGENLKYSDKDEIKYIDMK